MLQDLQKPEWKDKESIQHLADSMNEFVALWEGLFPPSFGLFVIHQLTDLVTSITKYGSFQGCGTLAGNNKIYIKVLHYYSNFIQYIMHIF